MSGPTTASNNYKTLDGAEISTIIRVELYHTEGEPNDEISKFEATIIYL